MPVEREKRPALVEGAYLLNRLVQGDKVVREVLQQRVQLKRGSSVARNPYNRHVMRLDGAAFLGNIHNRLSIASSASTIPEPGKAPRTSRTKGPPGKAGLQHLSRLELVPTRDNKICRTVAAAIATQIKLPLAKPELIDF